MPSAACTSGGITTHVPPYAFGTEPSVARRVIASREPSASTVVTRFWSVRERSGETHVHSLVYSGGALIQVAEPRSSG